MAEGLLLVGAELVGDSGGFGLQGFFLFEGLFQFFV